MRKKVFGIILGALLATIVLVPPARALEKVSVMLDWYPNPVHVPLYLAQAKGYFAAQGLEVDIMAPADPNDPLKLAAAGKIQFAVSYQPSVIMARDQGLPVVSLGTLVQHPLSCILYLKSSGIKTPADLKGRRIGYSVEPLYRVLFEAVAETAGLKKSDFELIRVGYNLSPPLLSGQVEAICGAFRNYEAIQIGMKGQDVGLFPFEESGVPDFYELVLISNSNLVKENPGRAEAFMAGLAKGISQTLTDPKAALEVFFKLNPELNDELNRKAFETTLPFFQGSPGQEPERWQKMQAFMLERGLIKKSTALKEMVRPGGK